MTKFAIAALAGLATAASAQVLSTGPGGGSAGIATVDIRDVANVTFTRGTGNVLVTIEFTSDVATWDLVSDPDNVVFDLDLGGGMQATMHGIGWDVTIQSLGASWLSEARMYFDDNIAPDLSGLFLAPGVADSFAGAGSYNSGGILDLGDNGIPDIVLPNGHLRLEFYESFDDVANAIDGFYLAGSVLTLDMTIVPAPGALALLGLGGLAIRRRR
ncbi:MAG: hypothetical protein Kow0022_03660 [Phycisphaerales bacterium]